MAKLTLEKQTKRITDEELNLLQKQLDEKKYRQSEIGRVDLSGKMEYCKCCNLCYQHFKQCQLDQSSREANQVCAKAELKRLSKEKQNEQF